MRPGDILTTCQRLRSVSAEKTTKLGTGRFWVIDVEYHNQRGELVGVESWTGFGYRRGDVMTRGHRRPGAVGDELPELDYDVTSTTVVLGALATRDWRPQHHDYHFATERNGVQDIFLNTPNQAAWFERYLTDWSGPRGRLGQDDVPHEGLGVPRRHDGDDRHGHVDVAIDDTGCGWVGVDVTLAVGERKCTTCTARVAVPTGPDDNPWSRKRRRWQP